MAPFGQLACLADVSQVIVLLFGPGSALRHCSRVDYSKVIISRWLALDDLRWVKKDWDLGLAKVLHPFTRFSCLEARRSLLGII